MEFVIWQVKKIFTAANSNWGNTNGERFEKKIFRDIYTLFKDDVAAAQQVLEVFRPIKTITTVLCHEKSPTVSFIHPLKEMLLGQLSRVADDDDLLVTAVKTAIHRNLEIR